MDIALQNADSAVDTEKMLLASTVVNNDTRQCVFSVPDISCGGCIQKSLLSLDVITDARVNLTHRRVTVQWREDGEPPTVVLQLASMGYAAHPLASAGKSQDNHLAYLLRALAVAAFASGNIMLLSVSVWSGADTQTNQLFHWVSAIIALPAIVYSGQLFFSSAWRALRSGTTNMDVPISIGIVLALLLSCYDTFNHTEGVEVYFEAPVMLVFFLLMGRTLDYVMREKVRKAADGLAKLEPAGARVVDNNGAIAYKPLTDIVPGDEIALAAGEVIGVDCTVKNGKSDIDSSLISGESEPRSVGEGDRLLAGTRNLTSALKAKVTASASDSHLAQMIELIRSAEQTRAHGRGLSERVSAYYAPVVHAAALLSFIGWFLFTGDAHQSITIAIAVLIITCPCALGLAVPMVHVVVARKLFDSGILLKNALALERLAKTDTVVFDKTGTLTAGEPQLINSQQVDDRYLEIAASMAVLSDHPYCRALRRAFAGKSREDTDLLTSFAVIEVPGYGLELRNGEHTYRLGKPGWAQSGVQTAQTKCGTGNPPVNTSQSSLSLDGRVLATFFFEDKPRKDAKSSLDKLRTQGLDIECLSGDNNQPVMHCAARLCIDRYKAEQLPADKVTHLESLSSDGKRVLMVGDGLNDAPALSVAYVSMAPGAASEVGRNSADIVFTRNSLSAVPQAIFWARMASRTVRQNLVFALLYNVLALPMAIAGFVTPLFAALAMSASSLIVISNSLIITTRAPKKNMAVIPTNPAESSATLSELNDRRKQHA